MPKPSPAPAALRKAVFPAECAYRWRRWRQTGPLAGCRGAGLAAPEVGAEFARWLERK
ncbi:MAG: hypothetical protein VW518_02655 [Burkholderiaceae bacterium]